MLRILPFLRKHPWTSVLVAALFPALFGGFLEYIVGGGISGWVPLLSGLAGGILTAAAVLVLKAEEPNPADREFTQRSPNELVEQIQGLTYLAAEPIVERYSGTWMRVQGLPVYDISESDGVIVVGGVPSYNHPGYSLSFDKKEWGQKLKILDRGDRLSAIGRISTFLEDMIFLEQCEILDDD